MTGRLTDLPKPNFTTAELILMNEKLKDYLDSRGATPLDASVVDDFKKKMSEGTIPQIVKNIKQSEQLVAEMRFSPTATSKQKTKRG